MLQPNIESLFTILQWVVDNNTRYKYSRDFKKYGWNGVATNFKDLRENANNTL